MVFEDLNSGYVETSRREFLRAKCAYENVTGWLSVSFSVWAYTKPIMQQWEDVLICFVAYSFAPASASLKAASNTGVLFVYARRHRAAIVKCN